MLKRIVSEVMLTLLFISMLTLTFNIQPVKAWTGTVYIRADGSIYPTSAPIITYDNITYTLTGNITSSGDGIIVERDGIIIDGNGFTLQGVKNGAGINLSYRSNIIIKNMRIKEFFDGIWLNESSNINIVTNNVTNNISWGIRLDFSLNNNINGNIVTANSGGIILFGSSKNRICGNTVTANKGYGILVWRFSDYFSNCNTVSGNNVTNNYDGILLGGSSNNKVTLNTVIANNGDGIWLDGSSNTTITQNTVISNNGYGIRLRSSNYNNVSGNEIATNSEYGLFLHHSNNNNINRNNLTANGYGIRLYSSSNNILRGNSMVSNTYNFGVFGATPPDFVNDVDASNTVDGRLVYYWITKKDRTVPVDAGYVSLINCTRITIQNLNLTKNEQGILLAYTNNTTIDKNNITANCWYGIQLYESSNNSIIGNNLTANGYGIYFSSSSSNSISGNNITNNNEGGIWLFSSSNNSMIGNNITANGYGISFDSSSNVNSIIGNKIANNNGIGINFYFSSNNGMIGNNITNNGGGIYLSYSSNNTISTNEIANNGEGIRIAYSTGNLIFHNNFIDNIQQAYIEELGYANVWDNGYPSGGNYWSDYVGVDVKNGSNQDLPGSDGIGDTPYVIDADNVDHYPLMVPYGAPPPTTYTLTITATVGGTTDPAPGTYSYTANSTVEVTAIPDAGYLFDYWELDGANVGSANPFSVNINRDIILKAVFTTIPPPLSASINPLSASILVGESVTFTSTVSGGYTPYTYQWYLNGNPVSGATSDAWTFTPTESGIFYVYLKVTDAEGNTAQSDTARITVAAVPVGGYSIPIQAPATAKPLTPYLILTAILTTIFTTIRRKTKRKH